MSKLQIVRKALFSNADITVIDIKTENYLPYDHNGWSETISIVVAPKKGIYDPGKLQELMLQLIQGLEPTCKDDFHSCGKDIRFGRLYFDETIGEEKIHREVVIADNDLLLKPLDGFTEGKCVTDETHELRRRTWVRLYPNGRIAVQAAMGANEYGIDVCQLRPGEHFIRLLHRLGLAS